MKLICVSFTIAFFTLTAEAKSVAYNCVNAKGSKAQMVLGNNSGLSVDQLKLIG